MVTEQPHGTGTGPPGEPAAKPPVIPALDVFDPAPVAVAVFRGPEHVLVYTNAVYRRLFGDRPLGVPAREALPDLQPREHFTVLDEVYRTGKPAQFGPNRPVRLEDGQGEVRDRWFSLSVSRAAPAGRTGTPDELGVLLVAMEVTGEVTAKERARLLSDKRLRVLQRYQSLVAAGAQKVSVSDRDGRLIEGSPGWTEVTGLPWERLRGHGWLDTAHPEDRAALAEAWQRAVREVPELFQHRFRLRNKDGCYRHCELRAVPIKEFGRVVEWVGACSDVEEQWQADRRKELLARASAAVTESARADRAFAAVGRVIVPELADACGVYLFPESEPGAERESGIIHRISATLRDGLHGPMAPLAPERVLPGSAFAQAIRERRPIHRRLGPGPVPPEAVPPGVAPWAEAAGVHDVVMFPVTVAGSVHAVVAVYACGERERFARDDLRLVRAVLDQSVPVFSTSLELRHTQRIALALQRSLLTDPPLVDGLEIVARYLPSSRADEVGGDWYDSFVLPDGATTLIIGDVAGHDLTAAVAMSKMRNMLRGLVVDRQEPPGDILRRLDVSTQILATEEGTATCVYARIEGAEGGPWQLHFSVAGHPPPLLVTAGGEARFLDAAQDIMLGGLAPDQERASAIEPLPPGSIVLLYTDGLVERPDEDIDEGLERLRRHAARLAGEPLDDFCRELVAGPAETSNDDIAVIAARMPGAAGQEPEGSATVG
ncbi:serine/threonine protein phosphatase [Streptomyces sp. Ru73]|uniref:SpoIIE family protein phosphatase n=1 Tax=Streptomyces sp. Ru73 TaxID=2080748 RepID=UPI000CDD75E1|nr:SpoIIE family protein phosphatase [Streptomyces sp. Ru73]POX37804.1 serine/threonine protein phosphatase [Streptomyces sp. Ru73]